MPSENTTPINNLTHAKAHSTKPLNFPTENFKVMTKSLDFVLCPIGEKEGIYEHQYDGDFGKCRHLARE